MQNSILKNIVRDVVPSYGTTSKVALLVGSILGLSIISANPAGAVTFGSNLIVNGDAESGTGSATGAVVPVPNWTTVGNFTVVTYANSSGFPVATDPGPASRGNNFFAGGNSASSSASQTISLSPSFSAIDAGNVSFNLSGFLGGFSSQDDNASLSAVFRNAGGTGLGTFSIGPVLAADRSSATGLLARSTSGAVPIGTRDILVTLSMTRLAGTSNDGYADNLSLVLNNNTPAATSVPEPSSIPGILVGGALVVGVIRKRKQKL
jgi:hypothetical protein